MSVSQVARCALIAIPIVAMCAALNSCTSDSQPVVNGADSGSGSSSIVIGDEEMASQLRDLGQSGETLRLSSLTDFEWDTVYIYFEGTSAEQIEKQVGRDVLGSNDFYYAAGCLMVFVRDGEVERAVSVVPDLFFLDGGNRFTSDVKVVPLDPGKRTGLRLKEPRGI